MPDFQSVRDALPEILAEIERPTFERGATPERVRLAPMTRVILICGHPGCRAMLHYEASGDLRRVVAKGRKYGWRVFDFGQYCPQHRSRHHPRKQGPRANDSSSRLPVILAARAEGRTFAQIAQQFGVTRQRIQQMVKKAWTEKG